jgi:hypothetical protein
MPSSGREFFPRRLKLLANCLRIYYASWDVYCPFGAKLALAASPYEGGDGRCILLYTFGLISFTALRFEILDQIDQPQQVLESGERSLPGVDDERGPRRWRRLQFSLRLQHVANPCVDSTNGSLVWNSISGKTHAGAYIWSP